VPGPCLAARARLPGTADAGARHGRLVPALDPGRLARPTRLDHVGRGTHVEYLHMFWSLGCFQAHFLCMINNMQCWVCWRHLCQLHPGMVANLPMHPRPSPHYCARLQRRERPRAAAQLVSTGAIACAEAGSHQRPNRHAELGRDMFRALERLLADPAATRGQRLLARRIYPRRALRAAALPTAARQPGCRPRVAGFPAPQSWRSRRLNAQARRTSPALGWEPRRAA